MIDSITTLPVIHLSNYKLFISKCRASSSSSRSYDERLWAFPAL